MDINRKGVKVFGIDSLSDHLKMESKTMKLQTISLKDRIFSLDGTDIDGAPWISQFINSEYQSLIPIKLDKPDEGQNDNDLDGTNSKMLNKNQDSFVKNSFPQIINEKITEKQNSLIFPLEEIAPPIGFMKIEEFNYDYVSSGTSNKVRAKFFMYNKVPITEVVQVDTEKGDYTFYWHSKSSKNPTIPFTIDADNTYFICVMYMALSSHNYQPFAVGSCKISDSPNISFQWTPCSSKKALSEHFDKSTLKIAMNIKVSYQKDAPPDVVKLLPSSVFCPSPYLTIHNLKLHLDNPIIKCILEVRLINQEDEPEQLYASPIKSSLLQSYKTNITAESTDYYLHEPISFRLNSNYSEMLYVQIIVREDGLIKAKQVASATVSLIAQKHLTKKTPGLTVDFDFLYPSLLAPSIEMRVPLMQAGVPPQFDSLTFSDLWPIILRRNILETPLNFLSAFLQRIPLDNVRQFAHAMFCCQPEFASEFLSKLRSNREVTERNASSLLPLLTKAILISGDASIPISFFNEVARDGGNNTRQESVVMLLRMREFFGAESIDPMLENFAKSVPSEARLNTLLPLTSDYFFLQGITDTIPPILQMLIDSIREAIEAGNNELATTATAYISNINGVKPVVLKPIAMIILQYGDIINIDKDTVLNLINKQRGLINELPTILASNAIKFLTSICQTEDDFERVSQFILTTPNLSEKNSLLFLELQKKRIGLPSILPAVTSIKSMFAQNKSLFNTLPITSKTIEVLIPATQPEESKMAAIEVIASIFENTNDKEAVSTALVVAVANVSLYGPFTHFYGRIPLVKQSPIYTIGALPRLFLAGVLMLQKAMSAHTDSPEILETLNRRIALLCESNSDYVTAYLAQSKILKSDNDVMKWIEYASKAGLHRHIMTRTSLIPDHLLPQLAPIAQSIASSDTKPKYWRLFVSGPVEKALGGSEFIFVGDRANIEKRIIDAFPESKVNSKPLPMFGVFKTSTIQTLRLKMVSEKEFTYDFGVPEDGWDDVSKIRYKFVTDEPVLTSTCITKCRSDSKTHIPKKDYFVERLSHLAEKLEKATSHSKQYSKLGYNAELLRKLIIRSLTPNQQRQYVSLVTLRDAQTPEDVINAAIRLQEAVKDAVIFLRDVAGKDKFKDAISLATTASIV